MKRLLMSVAACGLAMSACAHRELEGDGVRPTVADGEATTTNVDADGWTPQASSDDSWQVQRVGGDMTAKAEFADPSWRYDKMAITTPLPQGYPAPTPPGAIELKKYPGVRRAQVSRTGLPDVGMNIGFWPLFQHIQRREIAMTSPVEMEYSGVAARGPDAPGREYASTSGDWTMSFLYRTPDMGRLGADKGGVEVVDVGPLTVLSVGFRGAYGVERVEEGLFKLEQWLAGQSEWERAGEPRALYYNGPERRGGLKWGEIQVPVRRVGGRT